MNTYTLNLKGTKKRGTQDLTITMKADNKGQAFNFAYDFFERARHDSTTQWESRFGPCRVSDYIVDAASLDCYRGKYKVYRSSIVKIN